MSNIRFSISKTNYTGDSYPVSVDIAPGVLLIRVEFSGIVSSVERGQKIYLEKPGNTDWNGEYFIQNVDNSGLNTVALLSFRSATIVQSTPSGTSGTITYHEYDWQFPELIDYSGNIKHERDDKYIFFRKKLDKEVRLFKSAYTFVKTLYDDCNPYLIYFRIEQRCSGSWVEKYLGAFTINDIEWDITKCIATVNPYTFDQYFSYFKLFEDDNNIMDISDRYQAELGGALQFGDRWIKIFDLLDFFAINNMPNVNGIQSNFFNINPTGYSYPAGIDISDLENIMICAMADANHFVTSTADATELNMSFSTFLNALRVIFDVYWDVVDGTLVIEHEFYFTSTSGIDISDRVINYEDAHKINLEKLPRQEVFRMSQGDTVDMKESIIAYNDEILANQKDGGDRVTYTAVDVCTDLGWVYNVANGASIANVPHDGGILLGSFSPTINGVTGSYPKTSINLTWHYLIDNYHQYNRPRIEGYYFQTTVGRVYKLFESTKKILTREGLIIKSCCEDFNPRDFITTEWGESDIKTATENIGNGTIELDLLFETQC